MAFEINDFIKKRSFVRCRGSVRKVTSCTECLHCEECEREGRSLSALAVALARCDSMKVKLKRDIYLSIFKKVGITFSPTLDPAHIEGHVITCFINLYGKPRVRFYIDDYFEDYAKIKRKAVTVALYAALKTYPSKERKIKNEI